MSVFLSHRKADRNSALLIHEFLKKSNVDCFLDEFDEELQGSHNITQVIMDRVGKCSHLMAIVSSKTSGSWWVPFEVGVASEADRRICSFILDGVRLPDFLDIWPKMTKAEHLVSFVQLYQNDSKVLLQKSESVKASVKSSSDFHRMLKSAVGQR